MGTLLLSAGCNPIEEVPGENNTTKPTTYTSDYLFDIDAIPEIKLTVELDDWNNLLRMYDINYLNKELIPAHFTFVKGSEVFELDSIGIRIRGNTSRRRPEGNTGEMHKAGQTNWHHAHFALRLDEFIEKQKFCSVDRFNLKWHKDDPNYCREIYCYDLFKRYGVWSAPRASYCRLSLHIVGDEQPAYYGVYVLLEGVHKDFLKYRAEQGHLPGKNGNLWKASWGATLDDANSNNMGVEDIKAHGNGSKSYIYDLKTNKTALSDAKLQLQTFINELKKLQSSQVKAWAEEHIYVEELLKAYAVNVVVGMWDDYWNNSNNFYFYFDESGKFLFIPYDYDNTLGTSELMENSGTQNPLRWGNMDARPLITQLLKVPEFNDLYKSYLAELVNDFDLFQYSGSYKRIVNWQNMIKPYVANDTNEDMEINDYPAGWGNCDFYRLRTGNDKGGSDGKANFFLTKQRVINEL